jgi:hypothetical protein
LIAEGKVGAIKNMTNKMTSSEFFNLLDESVVRFEGGENISAILEQINNQKSALNAFAWEREDLIENWKLVSHFHQIFLLEERLEDYYEKADLLSYSKEQILDWCEHRLEGGFDSFTAIHFMPLRNSTIAVWCEPAGHGVEFSNLSINQSEQHHIQTFLAHDHVVDSFETSGLGAADLMNLYKRHVTDRLTSNRGGS